MAAARAAALGLLAFAAAFFATRAIVGAGDGGGPREVGEREGPRSASRSAESAPAAPKPNETPAPASSPNNRDAAADTNNSVPASPRSGRSGSGDIVIFGTLVDFDGKPIRTGTVAWVHEKGTSHSGTRETPAESTGRFELPIPTLRRARHRKYTIRARAPGRFDIVAGPLEASAGSASTLERSASRPSGE